ncbi:MAG TPA: glycosyltransferase family 2 protein [Candidatus Paceibacterota bacterium]|jgi:glycosyltransferase involved in cell wall biosynthesis|nr:glycosyltransferase family 2 protein [Candidatus Paceibacterota bacterium]
MNNLKTSVLLIAHNEESHISDSIMSVLRQNRKADEIVVVCHNCTDRTVAIAKSFEAQENLRVVEYSGPEGVVYARIRGFEEVKGDIVACLDGDSVADRKWLENIVKPLERDSGVSIVAGYVYLRGSWFARVTSWWQFVIVKKILKWDLNAFAWGASFACRKSDYEKVGGLAPLIELKDKLGLHFWAEDFYLSRALMQIGKLHVALSAKSYTEIPSWKVDLSTAPLKEWMEDNNAIIKFYGKRTKINTTRAKR